MPIKKKRDEHEVHSAAPKVLSIAPMVDVTDRHFRRMCRILTRHTLLYTEMITAQAIINGNRDRLLGFSDLERPIAIQIAGSDENEIAEACKLVEGYGFDEINLNVGCPSPKVSEYMMGASLMAYPEKVSEISESMRKSCSMPISIKHRLGIDGKGVIPEKDRPERDRYDDLKHFVDTVSQHGPRKFIVHARIAVLKGLNPHKNRKVPELRYEQVYRLKKDFPDLHIEINGGVNRLDDIKDHLDNVDGVMLGRVAYENPMILSFLDSMIEGSGPESSVSRRDVIGEMIGYAKKIEKEGLRSTSILKHMYGIFHGKRGSRRWKQIITPPYSADKASEILEAAIDEMDDHILDEKLNPEDF